MKTKESMNWRFLSLIPFMLLAITSCVTELNPGAFSFEKLLVVEGILTDEEKVHTVKLSYTRPVEGDSTAEPLTNAAVWVEDDLGERFNFVELSPGVYDSEDVFQGIEGHLYKLVFITQSGNGKRYESIPELLVKSPPIDRISNSLEELTANELDQVEQGLQFFVDTSDPTGKAQFFRYEWNDAVQTIVPHPAKKFKFGTTIMRDGLTVWTRLVPQTENVETCYKFGFSNSLLIANSLESSGNQVLDVPVRFAPVNYLNFMNRYSIEVVQYAVSQQAFNHYRKLKQFNEASGSLFDKQQGIVVGNIKSLDDNNEVVLGYFEVSGVSRLRKFYNPDELDQDFVSVFSKMSDICSETHPDEFELMRAGVSVDLNDFHLDTVPEFGGGTRIDTIIDPVPVVFRGTPDGVPADFLILDVEFFPVDAIANLRGPDRAELKIARIICADCRLYGKIVEKPAYWID